jgi:hypothetical protein
MTAATILEGGLATVQMADIESVFLQAVCA